MYHIATIFQEITFIVCTVVIWPCIHSIVVVTSPIGVHAPPAFAAITTTAPRILSTESKASS